MISINELRRLAQAALAGPDGISLNWIKFLQDFQHRANPAAILELIDRLEAAYEEKGRLLGLAHDQNNELIRLREECRALRAPMQHEADCVEAAEKERDALLNALETLAEHFEYYMGDNECRPLENARAAIAKATGPKPCP